jgi:hypothetical protein
VWRTHFGRGYGPVGRQTNEWMNEFLTHSSKVSSYSRFR